MTTIPINYPIKEAVKRILVQARSGVWEGLEWSDYFKNCSWTVIKDHMTLILTRDVNHHLSGWWKNPDYERCWHLSLAFYNRDFSRRPKNVKLTEKWLDLIFGKYKRLIWTEPPCSKTGIKNDSWHYRLFCDEHWQPIIPRGEVYTKKYTEPGWLSYSELQAYHKNEKK
jgi:hypothetical protein